MDPSAPSQPNQQTGLNQAGNPASKTSEEQNVSADSTKGSGPPIDHRGPHDVPSNHQNEATPTSLGFGDTGSLKEHDISESKKMNYSNSELDGEQMRAPGEGEVAKAVSQGGGGGHGEEASLTEDMDDKARKHKEELHARGQKSGKEIEEEEKEDWTGKKKEVDMSKALEGRGPAVVLAAEE